MLPFNALLPLTYVEIESRDVKGCSTSRQVPGRIGYRLRLNRAAPVISFFNDGNPHRVSFKVVNTGGTRCPI